MIPKPKKKKCRICKTEFLPKSSTAVVCGLDCAIKITEQKRIKKEVQDAKRINQERRQDIKRLRPKSWYAEKTKTACHAYIRYRDRLNGCISCGTTKPDIQYAAGHFKPSGNNSKHRYDEYNIHKQCNKKCNCELGGNYAQYKPNLIKKIGADHVDFLENDKGIYKWTIEELQEIEIYYKEKLKCLKSLNE